MSIPSSSSSSSDYPRETLRRHSSLSRRDSKTMDYIVIDPSGTLMGTSTNPLRESTYAEIHKFVTAHLSQFNTENLKFLSIYQYRNHDDTLESIREIARKQLEKKLATKARFAEEVEVKVFFNNSPETETFKMATVLSDRTASAIEIKRKEYASRSDKDMSVRKEMEKNALQTVPVTRRFDFSYLLQNTPYTLEQFISAATEALFTLSRNKEYNIFEPVGNYGCPVIAHELKVLLETHPRPNLAELEQLLIERVTTVNSRERKIGFRSFHDFVSSKQRIPTDVLSAPEYRALKRFYHARIIKELSLDRSSWKSKRKNFKTSEEEIMELYGMNAEAHRQFKEIPLNEDQSCWQKGEKKKITFTNFTDEDLPKFIHVIKDFFKIKDLQTLLLSIDEESLVTTPKVSPLKSILRSSLKSSPVRMSEQEFSANSDDLE